MELILIGLGVTHLGIALKFSVKLAVMPLAEWGEVMSEALGHGALGTLYVLYGLAATSH